jgi:hypothetical protein
LELLKAVQEYAQRHSGRVDLKLVHEEDAKGRIIRFGYFFPKETPQRQTPRVNWLRSDECEVEGSLGAGNEVWIILTVSYETANGKHGQIRLREKSEAWHTT